MFDQIDVAYLRLRAAEEREKAKYANQTAARLYLERADQFEDEARALLKHIDA